MTAAPATQTLERQVCECVHIRVWVRVHTCACECLGMRVGMRAFAGVLGYVSVTVSARANRRTCVIVYLRPCVQARASSHV